MVKRNSRGACFWLTIFFGVGSLSVGYAQEDWDKVLNLRGTWKFSIGDNRKWADPKYVDNDWENIDVPSNWEDEGFNGYNGYAWYRKTFDGSDLESKNLSYGLFL